MGAGRLSNSIATVNENPKQAFRVLVVDDSPVACRLVEHTLPHDEYEVLCAKTGHEALNLFAKHRPSLVITDWLMPDLSGIELCQRFRTDFQDCFTYIILLTGVSEKSKVVKGLQAGADEYLTKPFDAEELLARVDVGRRIIELHREVEGKNRLLEQLALTEARQQLSKREELFRLISENAADMIAVVDTNGQRIYNSPAYERILGYSVEELKATSSFDQIHPDDRQAVLDAAKEAREGGVGRRIEYRMRRKDGAWRLFESTASAVRSPGGEVEKLVIVNRDITERRQLEDQLRQSQKMDAIGRLSGGVAHDFNNLLGVIIGYSEVLQDTIKETDPLRGCVDQVLLAGKRAASLTRQLLAFSRQQVLEPKVLLLNAVVSDMEKMLRRLIGEDVELSTSLDPQLGKVRADQGQTEQVIMNLAVNARDAMPEGGKLTIQTANLDMDEAFVSRFPYPVQTGAYILLTVSDTGVGMDSATQQRIFEPFFTTKEKGKGTGLGLSMVYGVVKQSGGYIDVESSVGKGSSFKIYLPRVDQNVDAAKTEAAPLNELRGKETILLVEDEKILRTLTRNLLELYGYLVLEAANGEEALKISRENTGPIDLMLTDMVMPGISGRGLAQQLSMERQGMKVVYMSGYTGRTIGGQALLSPGAFFLQKPFTREKLARKIREALEARDSATVG